MERKVVFCKARDITWPIPLEECVPNPNHPACNKCDSPNLMCLDDQDRKHFTKTKAKRQKNGFCKQEIKKGKFSHLSYKETDDNLLDEQYD